MLRVGSFLLLMLLPALLRAQNHATTIKVQAMDMASALMNNNFNRFVRYMHPAAIELAGGEKEMKTKMDSAASAMKRFRVTFKKCLVGQPQPIVQQGKHWQSIYPQTTIMSTPMGELTVETNIIALSKDKGKSWWFIDTNVYQAEKIKKMVPDLSPQIEIPPRKKPTLKRPGQAP